MSRLPDWVEPAAQRTGPASLLDPARGIVPFSGREQELTALLGWCADDGAGLVRLVTGGGGAGKTRLSLELRGRLAGAGGWRCAEVDAGSEAGALAAERAVAGRRRLLLLVDYADARTGLAGLLDSVARDPERVKVLLLARQAGEWWQRLKGGGQPVRDMIADASREIIKLADAAGPGISPADVVRGALPYFAAELGVAAPDPALVGVTGAERRRVLDLHAAALVTVLASPDRASGGAAEVDAGTVLEVLLGHEKRYWQDAAQVAGLLGGPGGLSDVQLSQAVGAACLLGAASEEEASGLVSRVPGAVPSPAVASWLRGLYPPDAEGRWLGSLRPDRLAELHVTRELAASAPLAQACLSGLDERQARQALVLLARAAADDPAARPVLESALSGIPEVLAGIEAPRETMIAIANSIPYPSVALAEADASITGRIVATFPPGTSERASWQGTLSNRLADLGRREDALAAIEEAVAIYRDLAAARPDAFRPELAASLNNQSVRLAGLGRREDALTAIEEAVTIRRELAATRPDAFRPDLAASLTNQSNRLASLGRREDALTTIEEAVAIRRELAATRPDAFRPDLALSLNNQSVQLAGLGRWEDARAAIEEAVAIRRELAATRPDAFRSDLALSLNNQSVRLAGLERRKDALAAIEEAVAIRRELAATRPDAFRPDLALSLNNQSVQLAGLGRRKDALAAIEEAVAIYRDLAATRPDAFRPDLATSLHNQSLRLADRGRRKDALAAIEEAVPIYRDLAAARPAVFAHRLESSLRVLARQLSALGRYAEARAAKEEAWRMRDPQS